MPREEVFNQPNYNQINQIAATLLQVVERLYLTKRTINSTECYTNNDTDGDNKFQLTKKTKI